MADTKPKRAPGGNPALSLFVAGAKAVIVIVTILTVLIVGWLTWWRYRPDLLFSPVSRHVHLGFLDCRDNGHCPTEGDWYQTMVPEVFAIGDPRDHVVKRIRDAGFREWIVEQDREVYSSSGASFDPFPCSQIYNVQVTFDEADRLVSAESTFSGSPSCL